MKKILFLGAGSPTDPNFENIPGIKYMQVEKGIIITKPTVIESCHGCPDLMTKYSEQMQDIVECGNRVVGVLEGGLYFALPSIQATQVTFPIISCPLDFPSYQAFMVPSGIAAIASVGFERKKIKNEYFTKQRGKALHVAEKILDLEEDAVALKGEGNLENLERKLNDFRIKTSDESKLILTYKRCPIEIERDDIQIWANSSLDVSSVISVKKSEEKISRAPFTVQVRGDENLAIYAAKILSLRNADIREKLKEMERKKRKSYNERNIIEEIGDIKWEA
ncbi:MAG: hypothetical protein GTN36_02605 [Candidatus Aenigmarchaeota archaeon]|nr:hypothetical protein [Candidatus Aenigmarchaeota archaeon]